MPNTWSSTSASPSPCPDQFSDAEAAPLLCAGHHRLPLSAAERDSSPAAVWASMALAPAPIWPFKSRCIGAARSMSSPAAPSTSATRANWGPYGRARPRSSRPILLDAGVTFAPVGWIIPLALAHLRPGGTLAINAVHLSPIPELPYDLIYGERTVRSVANFTRQDAEEFLRIAAEITDQEQCRNSSPGRCQHRLAAPQSKPNPRGGRAPNCSVTDGKESWNWHE